MQNKDIYKNCDSIKPHTATQLQFLFSYQKHNSVCEVKLLWILMLHSVADLIETADVEVQKMDN